MSDKQINLTTPEASILNQLKQQHAEFICQRDLAQNNYNQLLGAVFACELMIKKHEVEAVNPPNDNLSDTTTEQEDGQVENEKQG